VLGEIGGRVSALVAGWSARDFDRSYAPGKWTAREILIHLAQCEIMFGTRVRMALITPRYVAQDMDQDAWMTRDRSIGAGDALDAFVALGRMNAALFESLSASDRQIALSHPDYGTLTIDWIIHQTAGHQLHHLKQMETVG
jgi:hypothetical protein